MTMTTKPCPTMKFLVVRPCHISQKIRSSYKHAEISTFLATGHETTSVSTTWALYALAKHPLVQSNLRQELLNAGLGDEPTMGELDRLPYLDAVLKETMRVLTPVPNVGREAAFDTVISVGEAYKDRKGVMRTDIK